MREDRVHGIFFLGKQFLQDPLVLRPAALPNPRRSRAQKTGGGAPTCEKGVRCAPPTVTLLVGTVKGALDPL